MAAKGKPAWRSRRWVSAVGAAASFFFEQATEEVGVAQLLLGGAVEPGREDGGGLVQVQGGEQAPRCARHRRHLRAAPRRPRPRPRRRSESRSISFWGGSPSRGKDGGATGSGGVRAQQAGQTPRPVHPGLVGLRHRRQQRLAARLLIEGIDGEDLLPQPRRAGGGRVRSGTPAPARPGRAGPRDRASPAPAAWPGRAGRSGPGRSPAAGRHPGHAGWSARQVGIAPDPHPRRDAAAP